MPNELDILYEDNHLLIINKPALISTMGGTGQGTSLVDVVREYIRERYDKPGNVYIGVVSRLDAWVTGAIVFARTSKAAARLNDQFRSREVQKKYWAIVSKDPDSPGQELPVGVFQHWIRKNEDLHRMEIRENIHCRNPPAENPEMEQQGFQRAELESQLVSQDRDRLLLEINLITGRKHQIRAQLSGMGWPVWGDGKYGSSDKFGTGIALHSRELSIIHPTLKNRLDIRAKLPGYWPEFAKKFSW